MVRLNISQSKIKTWRTCRRQYDYKYVEQIRKKVKSRPLVVGTIIHNMIEADANGDDPFEKLDNIDISQKKLFAKEREQYGEIIEDIRLIMTDYFEFWEGTDQEIIYSRKNKRSAEHEFEIEIYPGIFFKGKIDGVGRSQSMRWLVEHKTFKMMPNEDERWKSIQSSVYIRAIEMMGWWTDIEGTLWDYIRNVPPAVPGFTPTGKLSEKKINTLPSRVYAFLEAQGLEPDSYPKLIEMAENNRSSYFVRVYTPMNRDVIDDTWESFTETALEIADKHGKSKPRTIGQHCRWCDYELLCRGEVANLDLDFIKERHYTHDNEAELDQTGNDGEE